jgi:ankyrin repeat protein
MRKLRVTLVMFLVAAALACVLWGWQRASAKVSLHGLAKLGDVEGLRKALSDGLDPNEVEHDRHKMMGGWTPLMYAAEGGHFDCVAALIDAGADVNAEDTFTQPVLAYAAESPEIVELLLSHGADATRCTRAVQHSAIAKAFRLRQARSLQLILDAGVASSSECLRYTLFEYTLGSAPRPVDDAVLAILIRHTQGDLLDQGPALLWTAAESNAIESARLLLGFGVGVDARSPIGTTPLMAAAGSGSVEVVELLLDGGADRALKDDAGKTALDYVAVAETKGVAAERAAALRRMLSIGDDGG